MIDLRQNHFELFGLPVRFTVPLESVERSYHDLQGRVHPDRFADATDAERRNAMQWATHVNEAYETLRDPLKRARYMLSLRGVDPQIETNTAMPAEFLMAQMEWREAVEEAADAADVDELDRLLARVRRDMHGEQDALGRELDDGRDAEAAASVRRLMFYDKIKAEIGEAIAAVEE
jgi:molecular chaperone HscB